MELCETIVGAYIKQQTFCMSTSSSPEVADCYEVCLLVPRSGVTLVPCRHSRFCSTCAVGSNGQRLSSLPLMCSAFTTDCQLSHCDKNVTAVVLTSVCVLVIYVLATYFRYLIASPYCDETF